MSLFEQKMAEKKAAEEAAKEAARKNPKHDPYKAKAFTSKNPEKIEEDIKDKMEMSLR